MTTDWEIRERQIAAELETLLPDCPAWCVHEGGHVIPAGVDTVTRSATYEHHAHRRVAAIEDAEGHEPFTVGVERFERLHGDGTVETFPVLAVPQYVGRYGFSAAQCRQIAAAMLNTADDLDRLS